MRAERIRAGFESVHELAERAGIDPTWCSYIEEGRVLATGEELDRLVTALGGIPPSRIYEQTWRQLTLLKRPGYGMDTMSRLWRAWRDESHLLMSRDEINFYDRPPGLDHEAEVYVNLSCGTQRSPHLLQDTVSVLEALGVSFIAAAGPSAGCCGKPLFRNGPEGSYERHRTNRIERSQAWGATTHVNWCGACQQTSAAAAARQELLEGGPPPVREIQLIPFLRERVGELGDKVRWKREVRRRVIAEGHPAMSEVHSSAQRDIAGLLSMVPGVEVAGLYDGHSDLSPCVTFGLEGSRPPEWTRRPETPAEREDHRRQLAAEIHSRGADTVSCMHQTCHQKWSRYASDELAVVHPISVLAEALDCGHPDRYQEAVRHGNPQRLLEESRPRWESWGVTAERAAELAEALCVMAADDYAPITEIDDDPDSFAMQRRVRAGLSCGGGCGGCTTHSDPAMVQAW
nr:helix-turn-helix domain-containing protein [Kribbella shirazensis]